MCTRIAWCLVLGWAVCTAGGCAFFRGAHVIESGDLSQQEGESPITSRHRTEVFYPIPYASPPNLIVKCPDRVVVLRQQRADGFIFEVDKFVPGESVTWQAKGCLHKGRPAPVLQTQVTTAAEVRTPAQSPPAALLPGAPVPIAQ
jgi:hypothetical protein